MSQEQKKPIKRKENKKTLKKKIRKIINVVILFIFILLAVVQSWFAYQVISKGTLFVAGVFGKACSVLVDGDKLKKVNDIDDFGTPNYQDMDMKLNSVFNDMWDDLNVVHFSIVKEINGMVVSVFDSNEDVFVPYKISREHLRLLKDPEYDGIIQESSRPFHITAYTPIRDGTGQMVGIFTARFSPLFIGGTYIGIVFLIIALTFVGYIFSLIITRIMTMGITRPLETLDEKIRMVARAEGDLSQRVTFPNTFKEVEDLAEATNMVMESTGNFVSLLEEKQHRLEEKNRELAQQAEELEAQTEELIALNDNLEEALRKLQDTQVQLVQSEKMASLGQLTAGIAHEINTPLGAINSNINIIEMVIEFLKADIDLERNDKAKALLERVEKANDTNKMACERIMQIVRHLKNFARLDESDFKEADIHDGIESVLILSHNLLKHRIQVHREYGTIPLVKCFPNLLNQVFMNLIVNAAQAIPEKGNIWIRTRAEGETVFIDFVDNGVGISKENMRRIFDPGFTTKGVGVGTGLGLSICYKIVEKHNGKIHVQSQIGKGTTFTIALPVNNTFEQMQDSLEDLDEDIV